MLQCPSCDTTLDQDFGIVTCSNCKAVLMVEPSGQVRVGGEEYNEPAYDPVDTEDDNTLEVAEATDNDGFHDDESYGDFQEPSTETHPMQNFEGGDFDANEESSTIQEGVVAGTDFESPIEEQDPGDFFDSTTDPISDEVEEIEEAVFEEATNIEADFVGVSSVTENDLPDIEDEDVVDASLNMADGPDTNPVDVTAFANSEDSNLDEGELVYDITIGRLDSKDLRENLKYILMDEKLKVNHHEYLKKIRNGQVTIPNLNPIKAKRIIEQLQYFDISIGWKQKRIVMADLQDSDESPDTQEEAIDESVI